MDKYKKLASNTIIFAIGSFGAKIINFLLTRLYTSYMDSDMFGVKELIEITANFIIPIVTFSIAEAIIRYGLKKEYDKKEIFSTAVFTVLGGLGILALLTPLFNFIPYLDGYGFLLYLYVFCSCFRSICSNFVRARGMVRLFSLDGILATLSLLIFNLIFIAALGMGVKGFLISVILSDFCSGMFLTVVAKLHKFLSIKSCNKKTFVMMLKFSLPLVPAALLWIVTGFSDRLLIRYMDGPEGLVGGSANGIYTGASKIPNLIAMISTIFYQAWNMSSIMESSSEDLPKFYTKIYAAYESILCIAASFLIALVIPLSKILLNIKKFPEYSTSFRYTPVLVMAVLFMCLSQFLSSVYNTRKKTKNSFVTSLIAAVVNIGLNLILIPKFGIQGAGVATLASYFACYVARIIDARRYIPFKVDLLKTAMNTLVLLGMCGVIVFMPNGWIDYLIAGVCFITIANFGAVIRTVKRVLKKR